tara:strand:+ start:95 stop:517 length:423 start_codon:yes stop_codon:yes gene_type:complete
MIIDYILQPGIQLAFIIGILGSLMIKLMNYKINKNYKLGLNILGILGIYHYFILPIVFVHEFGAYEGHDYRNIFKNENGEPKYQNIIFRKDKQTTLEAVSLLVKYIKKDKDITTSEIIEEAYDLQDRERITVLAEKIDEN